MKPAPALVAILVLSVFTSVIAAQDSLLPLDTRTRCIVAFHECLLLIEKKDVDGIFHNIADGSGPGRFKLYPDRNVLAPDLQRELQDADQFFKHNFPNSASVKSNFNKTLFSALDTAKESVSVKSANGEQQVGKLHLIKIKIPEVDDGRFTELRFVEIADKLYWVPFGW